MYRSQRIEASELVHTYVHTYIHTYIHISIHALRREGTDGPDEQVVACWVAVHGMRVMMQG